MKKYQEPLV